MFTGIVTEKGEVRRARERSGLLELEVEAPVIARELGRGDSIAVNGVCLTAVDSSRRRFVVQAMEETIALSTIGSLSKGSAVNLELPARLSDRLGGHLVQGHVDGMAKVSRIQDEEGARRLWFQASEDILRYLVYKGSIAIDGVSLTVAQVGRATFQVTLIPHTLQATTLAQLGVGDPVNVEVDVIAKYVERLANGDS